MVILHLVKLIININAHITQDLTNTKKVTEDLPSLWRMRRPRKKNRGSNTQELAARDRNESLPPKAFQAGKTILECCCMTAVIKPPHSKTLAAHRVMRRSQSLFSNFIFRGGLSNNGT